MGDADGASVGLDDGNFVSACFEGDADGDVVGTVALDGANVAGFSVGVLVSPPILTGALVGVGGPFDRDGALLNEGAADGCSDGLVGGDVSEGFEGNVDGATVMWIDGELVGLEDGGLIETVGFSVPSEVPLFDGEAEGCEDGLVDGGECTGLDGDADGALVGLLDGNVVGLRDGGFIEAVGPVVPGAVEMFDGEAVGSPDFDGLVDGCP